MRLEEDLQRAAADAGVVDGDGAVDRILVARTGLDPQQQRLAGLQHAQGVEAYARLSAMAADEALDAAVRVDQRGGADRLPLPFLGPSPSDSSPILKPVR